jgi:acyl-[acyl-carrier-protein]-phospholipid O-acyltransferase/long-chain-fatty-acid--[acyl-carrier-protein] ligase
MRPLSPRPGRDGNPSPARPRPGPVRESTLGMSPIKIFNDHFRSFSAILTPAVRTRSHVTMLLLLRLLLRLLFRFRAHGTEVLSTPGPVLLLPNHVSWFDWLFLGACLEGDWRFVTSSTTAKASPLHRWIMDNRRTFPIDPLSPYAAKHMAEYLQGGGRLVLFPEGRISDTGSLMKLFDGTGFLLHKTGARVITAYLRGAHRLPFSRNRDDKRWFPRVSVHFSPVLTPPKVEGTSTAEARDRLTEWVRDRMIEQHFATELAMGPRTLAEAIRTTAALRPGHAVLEDITGSLTYRRLTMGAALLSRRFASLLPRDSLRVGVLLPNVNSVPVTLYALWSLGKVPAILNFTTGPAIMLACARLAGLTHILTSRAFIEKARLKVEPLVEAGLTLVYLEDVRASIGTAARTAALLRLIRLPRSPVSDPQATAVVLFTSGSEGVPKGVELSHANLLANVGQLLAISDLQDTDRMFNALPLFHSFGLTAGLLLPLLRGFSTFLYPSPLHYRIVPMVAYLQNSTVLLATNTFLNLYARRAHAYDFRSLRYLFAGAEKIQEATSALWAQRFGIRILEGYGATECSPVISVNTPLAPRHGSAGRLMPGMDYRLEPIEGVPAGGRLFVRGPNVMKGYLNPDADAKFKALEGWYDTGDIVTVDDQRFIKIQGRLKRFAKISGEMISLTAVEDALGGAFPQHGLRCQVAVVSRPDEDKGEKLIAVTNEARLTLDEVRGALRAKGLPNLAMPREIKVVASIPKLGTGKTDYRELEKQLTAAT